MSKYVLFKVSASGEEMITTGELLQLKVGRSAVIGENFDDWDKADGWITSVVKKIDHLTDGTTVFQTLNSTYRLEPMNIATVLH